VEKTSVMRQSVNNAQFLLFKKSWFADYPDDENFMGLFYSRNFAPDGVNFFHYRNARFDSLYEAVRVTTDESKKTAMIHDMERIVIDDAPVIPLYYDEVLRLVDKRVSGLATNPMNMLNLKTVRVE
jgi:peptide/nickel transport system substrate-binding protein